MHKTPGSTQTRKSDHVTLALDERSDAKLQPFAQWQLMPQALPELSRNQVSIETELHGWKLDSPLWIAGMTGGMDQGESINRALASAAEAANIPMGLGSLKILLEDPSALPQFQMKRHHPRLRLVGNLGLHSLNYGVNDDDILRLIEWLDLDAIAFHLNPLQESIQPEGQTEFSNLLPRLAALTKKIGIPVWVKEVGNGISRSAYHRLSECGVAAVDLGGRGGTNWSRIEAKRAEAIGSKLQARLGEAFRDWGLTTEESLRLLRADLAQDQALPVIATGGMRDGLQAAKALAFGASLVGAARPFLQAAISNGEQGVRDEIEFFAEGLRTALFCAGIRHLHDLRSRRDETLMFMGNL